MSAHTHSTLTPGCYRCDLGREEAAWAEQEAAEQAAREAACPGHIWVQFTSRYASWAVCSHCRAEEGR